MLYQWTWDRRRLSWNEEVIPLEEERRTRTRTGEEEEEEEKGRGG
jgi:hypothetical protein